MSLHRMGIRTRGLGALVAGQRAAKFARADRAIASITYGTAVSVLVDHGAVRGGGHGGRD